MLVVLVSATVVAQEPTRDSPLPGRFTVRPEITGHMGVVAAGRHYAVAAGMRMLESGGNAFDAGVAATFAAAVTEFNLFGFGGESPAIIYDAKSQAVVVVNGQGPAPKAATPALYAAQGWVDGNGPHGATIPAVVDAMALILENYGTMSLAEVLAPAIEYADGFVMYEYLHKALVSQRAATEKWEWSRKTYYPEGKVSATGEIFRQPYLAATMRRIVAAEQDALLRTHDRKAGIRAGRDDFYRGTTAKTIAAAMAEAGGVMTYDDLATYQGRLEKPLRSTFHAYEIFKADTWNQGPALLQTLNLLEGYDLARMGLNSDEYIHTVTEAIKLAYADRNVYYGDPDFATIPTAGLLSKTYAERRRKEISSSASLEHRPGDPYAFDSSVRRPHQTYVKKTQGNPPTARIGDTTAIEVVDRHGNLFSCTPSSGWLAGGAFVAGDTGVPMSNRMTIFDLDPLSPNYLVGGKRPRTTLTPTIVFKDGKPWLAIGTPGGDNQDQQILNVLLPMMVFGFSAQEAIEVPRINSLHFHSSFRNHQDQPGVLEIESRVPESVRAELAARGHKLRVTGPWGVSTGVVVAGIRPDTGTLFGAADPRRERYVMGR